MVVWFCQSDGFDQKTMSLYLALASRKKASRIAWTLTMGMPQIAASTARLSSMRRWSSSELNVCAFITLLLVLYRYQARARRPGAEFEGTGSKPTNLAALEIHPVSMDAEQDIRQESD